MPACSRSQFIDTEAGKLDGQDEQKGHRASRPATRASASVGRRLAVWCLISPSPSLCVGTEK